MLYPYVSKERLIDIFGHDLLDDESMGQIFYSLINPDATKPFECVGTREEINYSIKLAIENSDASEPLPKLLEWCRANYSPTMQYNVAQFYNPEHNIPEEYLKALVALWKTK